MPRFAANLSMLWPELEVYDRFRAAAEAGFSRVEILFVHTLDHARLERALKDHKLELVLFDPEPGDWEAGERGLACKPGREQEFETTIRGALETAKRLGVRKLNVLTGIPDAGTTEADAKRTIIRNFESVAPLAEASGVMLLIENINTTDFPGYFVSTVIRAAEIVDAVGRANVRVQLDQYHVGMMGGDAQELMRKHAQNIAHIQIADVPGRHEPGTGQQPIPEFLNLLDEIGYAGAVGLEYRPSSTTDAALAWLPVEQRA